MAKKWLLLGYGVTNQAVAEKLKEPWILYDDFLKEKDLPFIQEEDLPKLWGEIQGAFVSPGFPPHHKLIKWLWEKRIPLITEVAWARERLKGIFIGVTGTNGKSTVVALLAHILKQAGQDAHPCGNYGTPLAQYVPQNNEQAIYVVELSSFQLYYLHAFPLHWAILTSLSPDHLTWHGTYQDYRKAKEKIFTFTLPDCSLSPYPDIPQAPHPVAGQGDGGMIQVGKEGLFWDDSLWIASSELAPFPPGLWQNFALGSLCLRLMGLDASTIARGLTTFTGLPHRQEVVAYHHGITFINDSKATNPEATAVALKELPDHRTWLLLGGKDKGLDITLLVPLIKVKCKGVILYGETRFSWANSLASLPIQVVETLAEGLEYLFPKLQEGDYVLLSPATASFDQFHSFAHRGEVFKKKVYQCLGIDDPISS